MSKPKPFQWLFLIALLSSSLSCAKPDGFASGNVQLTTNFCEIVPESKFDFDHPEVFPPSSEGADFVYTICGGSDVFLVFMPLNGAMQMTYGTEKPNEADCRETKDKMSIYNNPELPSREYFCFLSSEGRYFWIRMDGFSEEKVDNNSYSYFLHLNYEVWK